MATALTCMKKMTHQSPGCTDNCMEHTYGLLSPSSTGRPLQLGNHCWKLQEIINDGVCMRAKSLQSCSTLYNPMDCSPPGSSVHGKNTGVGCHDLAVSQQLTCRLEKGAPGYWNKGVLICERQTNRGKALTPLLAPHPTPARKNNHQAMAHR